jgi:hypothetical protein
MVWLLYSVDSPRIGDRSAAPAGIADLQRRMNGNSIRIGVQAVQDCDAASRIMAAAERRFAR